MAKNFDLNFYLNKILDTLNEFNSDLILIISSKGSKKSIDSDEIRFFMEKVLATYRYIGENYDGSDPLISKRLNKFVGDFNTFTSRLIDELEEGKEINYSNYYAENVSIINLFKKSFKLK